MLMNPKLPSSIVDSLPTNKYSFVRRSMLKPEHYHKIIDHYNNNGSGSSYDLNDHSAYFGKDHIDKLAASPKIQNSSSAFNQVLGIVAKSPHFSQEHHDKLMERADMRSTATHLLENSKFATIKDADKISGQHIITSGYANASLANNKHISSETAIHIKDRLVSGASLGSSKEMGGYHTIQGYGNNTITPVIAKHLTPDDHVKLAESQKSLSFENSIHSEKHLNAIESLVTKADNELGDHIANKTQHHEDNDLDEYDHTDGEDEHANHLVEKLHGHIENYARTLDNHLDHHVAEGRSNDEYIKDHKQHDVVQNHLDHLNNLENYKTPHNSNRYDGHEHYQDHIADIHDRMHKLHSNTEDRDNHEHDNW